MKIFFHKNFIRQFKKLSGKEQSQIKQRLAIFLENPYAEILNNHALKGKYLNYRSINIKGDLRVIYKYLNEDECVFTLLGTHSQLYHE